MEEHCVGLLELHAAALHPPAVYRRLLEAHAHCHTALTHAHRASHFECRAGSCRRDVESRGTSLALAPPPRVCVSSAPHLALGACVAPLAATRPPLPQLAAGRRRGRLPRVPPPLLPPPPPPPLPHVPEGGVRRLLRAAAGNGEISRDCSEIAPRLLRDCSEIAPSCRAKRWRGSREGAEKEPRCAGLPRGTYLGRLSAIPRPYLGHISAISRP